MIRTAKLACVTLGLILPTAASADDLAPLQAGTFGLHDHVAAVYYTVKNGNFEVVTTFAPSAGDPVPARCTAQLAPGQIATVSVGAPGAGVPPAVLRFERDGDTLRAEVVGAEGQPRHAKAM
jgi:hypothetical protein